jgi:hypothetical protein
MPGQKRVFALDDPGIHARKEDVDGRDRPGHDDERALIGCPNSLLPLYPLKR